MKRMHITLPLIAVAMLAAMTSCTVYHPQSVDIPLIEHRGELRAEADVNLSTFIFTPNVIAAGATATYGATDWLAAQLHVNGGTGNYYLQAAPGVYTKWGEKGVVECYAGLGYGGASTEHSNTARPTHDYQGSYLLPFIQANGGWRHLGAFEIALGLKVGAFCPDYTYVAYKYDDETGARMVKEQTFYDTPNLLIEPQLQVRVGRKNVHFTFRMGYTWLSDMTIGGSEHLTYANFMISNGVSFTF